MKRIRNDRRKKSSRSAGFTLAETLMVVLLVSLMSAAVAGGILVLRNVYAKVTLKAEAQTVLSTTMSALEKEFPYAADVDTETAQNPSFRSGVSGARISFQSSDTSSIVIHYENQNTDQPLLTDKTVTDRLRTAITYTYRQGSGNGEGASGVFSPGVFQVKVQVFSRETGAVLAECPADSGTFTIRVLNS